MPGWRDAGPLFEDSKLYVRRAVEEDTDRHGVIKHLRGTDPKSKKPEIRKRQETKEKRFWDEARHMRKMTEENVLGILPVWDLDPGDEPCWYAMPEATLLGETIGQKPTLLDVVTPIATLAGVLADLADKGTYHRDIKPGNLFHYNNRPVLGDFGIAAFGVTRAGLTQHGEKVGPSNFLAPEMRAANTDENFFSRADVYSLAKTLFVLAQPGLGDYPPDGTHRADACEFAMEQHSGSPGLASLRHLLEAATQFDVMKRLSMAEFHEELQVWVTRHSSDRTLGIANSRGGLLAVDYQRQRAAVLATMRPSMQNLAEVLTGESWVWSAGESWVWSAGESAGGFSLEENDGLLGNYDKFFDHTHTVGYVPEGGTVWCTTRTSDGRRLIVKAPVDDGEACFIIEYQAGDGAWTLEHQWDPTSWRRAGMPSSAEDLRQLTERVVAFIQASGSAAPPVSTPAPGRRRRTTAVPPA